MPRTIGRPSRSLTRRGPAGLYSATMAGGEVQLVDLVKRFGDFTAVAGINLDMPSGEFFSLLGPSGCGKTTTLRMIAGFERPSRGPDPAGRRRHGADPAAQAQRQHGVPELRVVPAPHGRRQRGVRLAVQEGVASRRPRERVGSALELVQMSQFANRRPSQLSGGQQQRVALARALDPEPRRAAARRAARRPRRQAPQAAADRAEGPAGRGRDHVHLRDARPGRGPHDVATASR